MLHKYMRPEFEKIAAKNNQTILYTVPWPTQYLHLKVKVESLDALKGIKIRVPDKNAQDMCSAIGMAPALIPWGETIAGAGVGRGLRCVDLVGVGRRRQVLGVPEVLPPDQSRLVAREIVTINNDTWKKISPANQKIIVDLAKKLEPEFWAVVAAGRQGQQRQADRGRHAGRDPVGRR